MSEQLNSKQTEKLLNILIEISEEENIAEDPDQDLFENGYLDSLMFVELIVELSDEFDISIAPTEFEREDVSTVNKIKAMLTKKINN